MALALLTAPLTVGIPAIALAPSDLETTTAPPTTQDPEHSPDTSPSPDPTDDPSLAPTDDPTDEPTTAPPSPTPTPDPTTDPASPPQPPDEDPDDGSGGGQDGGIERPRGSGPDSPRDVPRDDRVGDPSTGNGRDGGRAHSPSGGNDWVPQSQARPDYADPVPQPPGSEGDSAITPDGNASSGPPADSQDEDGNSLATDSLAEKAAGGLSPWPIITLVGIGGAAIGFVLFMARRTRR